jgi:hypothetical protein
VQLVQHDSNTVRVTIGGKRSRHSHCLCLLEPKRHALEESDDSYQVTVTGHDAEKMLMHHTS